MISKLPTLTIEKNYADKRPISNCQAQSFFWWSKTTTKVDCCSNQKGQAYEVRVSQLLKLLTELTGKPLTKSLIRRKSRRFVEMARSKSRITSKLISKSIRRPKKWARGGIPWFILTISCFQIANFFVMYKRVNTTGEDWWKWNENFNTNVFIFFRLVILMIGVVP